MSFLILLTASTTAITTSNLEKFSAVVAPYTICEIDGKAKLKSDADEWTFATQAAYKNPGDVALKATADKLFKQYQARSQAVRDGCGYERVHSELRERISKLHPKMKESEAFWFARGVFSSLNNLNEHIVRFERGDFPKPPPAPPR